jgi:hypothetical protein
LSFLAAERVSQAMLFASGFVQAMTRYAVLLFHPGQAANQAMVLALEGLMLLGQHGQAAAQVPKIAVTFLAAETRGMPRGRGDLHELGSARRVWSWRCFNSGASPWYGHGQAAA